MRRKHPRDGSRSGLPVRETLILAVPLVAALVGIVPALAIAGKETPIGFLPTLLGLLFVVGVGHVYHSYRRNQLIEGVYVSFFVLSTFAANLPILESAEFFRLAPGNLGPQIWLMQGPLLVLVGYHVWAGDFTVDSVGWGEVLFGGFVAWSVVAALLGAGPRTDVALYFSWLLFQALIVLAIIRRGVERRIVTLESVVTSYVVAVGGHVAFGFAQLWTQGPVGLSFLGESVLWNDVTYPPGIGNVVIPSGLTGHGYVLVSLILLTFPTLLWFVVRSDRTVSALVGVGAVIAAAFVRLTTSDAGRGAFLVMVGCLAAGSALLLWGTDADWPPSIESLRSGVARRKSASLGGILVTAVSIVAILYPSSKSGTGTEPVTNGGTNLGTGSSNPAPDPSNPADSVQTPDVGAAIENLSVPLFDLSHLGMRVKQYVVGLDIFKHNPVFGLGGGNYPFVAVRYPVTNQPTVPLPQTIHNNFLLVLVETGLPGFLLYLGAIAYVLVVGVRSCLEGHKRFLRLSVIVGIVGYLAMGTFVHTIDKAVSLLPFWALAGAIVGEYSGTSTDKTRTRSNDE